MRSARTTSHSEALTADSSSPRLPLLYFICLLAVSSTVSWRPGTYFSGALDPVVVLKAVLSVVALALAVHVTVAAKKRFQLGPRTLGFAAAYLAVTVIGGWAAGTFVTSGVVASRVGMLTLTLLLVLSSYTAEEVVIVLSRVMGGIAGVAIFTGLGSISSGRLQGGLPPLTPNELAFLCGLPLLLVVRRILEGRAAGADWPRVFALLTVVWLTGSRTGAVAIVVAVLVMILQARRLTIPVFVGLVLSVPAMAFLALGTSVVTDMLTRGGDANVATLSSRTIAWDAALNMHVSGWQHWFGGGLDMKRIPVSGQYWNSQILDSSWISALVQGGYIGIFLVFIWSIFVVFASLRSPKSWRPLWTGLLIFVLGRSALESGLFDATPAYAIFLVASFMSEPAARAALTSSVHQT